MHNSFKYVFSSIACFAIAVSVIIGVFPFDPIAEMFVTILAVLIGSLSGIAAIDSSKK